MYGLLSITHFIERDQLTLSASLGKTNQGGMKSETCAVCPMRIESLQLESACERLLNRSSVSRVRPDVRSHLACGCEPCHWTHADSEGTF